MNKLSIKYIKSKYIIIDSSIIKTQFKLLIINFVNIFYLKYKSNNLLTAFVGVDVPFNTCFFISGIILAILGVL